MGSALELPNVSKRKLLSEKVSQVFSGTGLEPASFAMKLDPSCWLVPVVDGSGPRCHTCSCWHAIGLLALTTVDDQVNPLTGLDFSLQMNSAGRVRKVVAILTEKSTRPPPTRILEGV